MSSEWDNYPRWEVLLNSGPATEPVTTAEVKAHLRIDFTDDDTLLDAMTAAARRWCENFQNRKYVDQTWELYLDKFPTCDIFVPFAPVDSITSITYTDGNGDAQTWSSSLYETDLRAEPARIRPVDGESYPDTDSRYGNVKVTFVVGYGAAAAVPDMVKTAVKQLVASTYEHRGEESIGGVVQKMPQVVEFLLQTERVFLPC